jgi:ferric-dicitrate binding protein FerR (iron transport regulator)
MKEIRRTGILIFLYNRGELSSAEQEELMSWRNQSPENENLFLELTDPVAIQMAVKEIYQSRDRVFEKLKKRVPWLSEVSLSGSMDPEVRTIDADEIGENELANFSVTDESEKETNPVAYWESVLSCLDDKEETDEAIAPDKKVVDMFQEPTGGKVIRKGRFWRRFFRVAVAIAVLFTAQYFLPGHSSTESKYKNYRVEIFSSDVVDRMKVDYNSARTLGWAGIWPDTTEKGEPMGYASNRSIAPMDEYFTLRTNPGDEYILQFPDGSRAWMNAASTMQYPANFRRDTIRIAITGEVYFEISKDSPHHFLIMPSPGSAETNRQPSTLPAGRQASTLLRSASEGEAVGPSRGSSVNINSYGENEILASVVRGAASLNGYGTDNNLKLVASQQARIDKDSLISTVDIVPDQVIAWKNGEFYFKDATLPIIMPAIANWYGVEIHYAGRIPDKKFSLRLPRSVSLLKVMDSLRKQGVQITLEDKVITIRD